MSRSIRRIVSRVPGAAIAATLFASLALVSGVRAGMAETFAYVGNADSNDISVFKMSESGEMTLVQTAAFKGVEKPGSSTPLAITPDHRVLIAGIRSQPYVAVSFAIDPKTGELSHLGNGPLADSMAYIAIDRSGKFLFSASYGGNKVALNPLFGNGVAGEPKQVIPTGLNAHAFLPSPDNRFAFATNLGSDQVLAFAFDAAAGTLTPSDPPAHKVPEKSGPRHFVFHPGGKFVYLLHELNGDVAAFTYEARSGAWDEIQRTTALPDGFSGKPWGADIHITPDGRFLYASERTTSTLTAYKVDGSSGKLTTIGSVPTEKQPRGFQVDPAGRYLAAVGELSDSMTVYAIDQGSGALAKLKSYPTGKKPNWVEFLNLP
ncbi:MULTISPECIES: lactonase family protein [Bradyrhizobium]|uniref:lactonase family protein n=1 Tax=Bradyrhizobium TaxID=374 RepID=UPI00155F2ED8|nr:MULTISPECIES: lactonase family protein [Bradyrhizobium]MDD1523216.1 6-phosphogluconolactonase [Bradyrhizobium sp. WBAH30]MDD1547316.1 6-phosphogluconolactonase [Bradyrhizobium sp. WBAH41]MDD1560887.1 6-phosphogluconolactonase [Bradyrhizobium sp. WBAH23]MDD1568354.1 6-phosphogluconolactonase [Bradyrhizobium sp. WBAH33]MDD1594280.1 6-phosphogluconolactonase [Bradyrhizobium sp. WBAH42]